MNIINIFILGIGILVGALIINTVASLFGLSSWYGFIQGSKNVGAINHIWLFVLYPLLLGVVAYLVQKII